MASTRLFRQLESQSLCLWLAPPLLAATLLPRPCVAESHGGRFEARISCAKAFARATGYSPVVESALYANDRTIQTNDFYVLRTLLDPRDAESYAKVLPAGFLDALSSLREGNHWVDVGAGAGRAARDYLSNSVRFSRTARVTAISVRRPPEATFDESLLRASRLRYLDGRPIQAIPAGEIGLADIVTDVFGALTYDPDFIGALRSELNLLRVGGSLFATGLASTSFLAERPTTDGPITGVSDLIRRFSRGLRIVGNAHAFQIVREREDIELPELELLEFEADTPPERVYLVKRPRRN